MPLSNQPYRLEGIGPTPLRGVTDAAGNIRFEVPLNLDRVRLVLEACSKGIVMCRATTDFGAPRSRGSTFAAPWPRASPTDANAS